MATGLDQEGDTWVQTVQCVCSLVWKVASLEVMWDQQRCSLLEAVGLALIAVRGPRHLRGRPGPLRKVGEGAVRGGGGEPCWLGEVEEVWRCCLLSLGRGKGRRRHTLR